MYQMIDDQMIGNRYIDSRQTMYTHTHDAEPFESKLPTS